MYELQSLCDAHLPTSSYSRMLLNEHAL
jgi:hypothetical protein